MTGFKEGAAASGFDDGDDPSEDDTRERETASEGSETADEGTASEVESESGQAAGATGTQLPWIYERDNARDGRPRTKQIHLQPSTAEREGAFRSEVESVLGESVNLTDLREASLLVAMDHVDEVAVQLREWGYDFD